MKQLQAAGDSREFRYDIAEVGDDQTQHHEKCDPQAIFFADQVAQTLARRRTHTGRHLLHNNQGDGHGDHDPEQKISKLGSGSGIGVNAAGVIVDIRGDEPGADDGQEHQQADSPDFKPSRFRHDTGSYGEMAKTSQNNRTLRNAPIGS